MEELAGELLYSRRAKREKTKKGRQRGKDLKKPDCPHTPNGMTSMETYGERSLPCGESYSCSPPKKGGGERK